MIHRMAGWALAAALIGPAVGTARAQASLPWTPDAATRHALHLLADEAGLPLPLTQWPLPRAAVSRAIDALPSTLAPSLEDARARVRRALDDADGGQVGLQLRGDADVLPSFGDDGVPGSAATVRSRRLLDGALALQLGARWQADRSDADPRPLRLEGSALAAEAMGVQLQAWSRRSWWGPGWQGSLALGHHAPAMNGIGLQRASAGRSDSRWLSWMGPWNAEVFAARTDGIEGAYVLGTRLTMQPWSGVEIGVTRATQWGGRGKLQTPGSLARALIGRDTNVETGASAGSDPGSGIGGFDLRLRCPAGWRCSAWTQLIGEDEAGALPSKYLGLYGIDTWTADGAQRFTLEYLDSTCGTVPHGRPRRGCAYRNHAYAYGYTHAGRWLGTSAGPDSQLLSVGWLHAPRGTSLRLHAGRIGSRIGSFSPLVTDPRTSGHALAVNARQDFAWRGIGFTAELDWQRVRAAQGDRSDARAGLQARMAFD